MSGVRAKIMLVDDDPTTLAIGKSILAPHYEVYPLPSAEKLFQFLEKVTPALILLDVEMPGVNGYDVIIKLKADGNLTDIPIIFLTSHDDESSEVTGLSLGAIDYITKPFSAPSLLRRISNHLLIASQKAELKDLNENLQDLVKQKSAEVVELQNAIIAAVSELVEFRDSATGGHINRVQEYLLLLVNELIANNVYRKEMADWDLDFLVPSAQLHDLGKIAISDAILNKPGKLTPEEFEVMKTHVDIGLNAIDGIERNTRRHVFLKHAKGIIGGHHEKWDGSGYPGGLKGEEIPLEGRIMALVDVYDALVSARRYKPAVSRSDAAKIVVPEKSLPGFYATRYPYAGIDLPVRHACKGRRKAG
ncbi:MAG: response regulator, partial [Planctomycetota bacterium]|nr:response regulator [Planctomycetota bacterium]